MGRTTHGAGARRMAHAGAVSERPRRPRADARLDRPRAVCRGRVDRRFDPAHAVARHAPGRPARHVGARRRVAGGVSHRGGVWRAKPPVARRFRRDAGFLGHSVISDTGLHRRAPELEGSLLPVTAFPDEWLAQSVEGLTPERLQELREKSNAGRTLWECVVDEKIATDAAIIDKLSPRFRLKIADVSQIDRSARDSVPEQLARRHHVLPLRLTDSYLEIGTSNPLDLDAEKALAFNTAREIRLFLLSPSKISEKLDEMYKPEKAIDKRLEGRGDQEGLTTRGAARAPEELGVWEAAASQKPVVRLVDMIISEGILSRASDIHVEPEEGGVAVRYRIDGV